MCDMDLQHLLIIENTNREIRAFNADSRIFADATIENTCTWLAQLYETVVKNQNEWVTPSILPHLVPTTDKRTERSGSICLSWPTYSDEEHGYYRSINVLIGPDTITLERCWQTDHDAQVEKAEDKLELQDGPDWIWRWYQASVEVSDKHYPCPCCGYMSFEEKPGSYAICEICFWEDDHVQLRQDWWDKGGANSPLRMAQKSYQTCRAEKPRLKRYVRPVLKSDRRDPDWYPLPPLVSAHNAAEDSGYGMQYFDAACASTITVHGSPYYWRWQHDAPRRIGGWS